MCILHLRYVIVHVEHSLTNNTALKKWKYWFINVVTVIMRLQLAALSLQQKTFSYMKRQTDSKQIHCHINLGTGIHISNRVV